MGNSFNKYQPLHSVETIWRACLVIVWWSQQAADFTTFKWMHIILWTAFSFIRKNYFVGAQMHIIVLDVWTPHFFFGKLSNVAISASHIPPYDACGQQYNKKLQENIKFHYVFGVPHITHTHTGITERRNQQHHDEGRKKNYRHFSESALTPNTRRTSGMAMNFWHHIYSNALRIVTRISLLLLLCMFIRHRNKKWRKNNWFKKGNYCPPQTSRVHHSLRLYRRLGLTLILLDCRYSCLRWATRIYDAKHSWIISV